MKPLCSVAENNMFEIFHKEVNFLYNLTIIVSLDKLEDWRKKYRTFQGAYSTEMITDLMNVAGKNISNCKEKLMEEISAAIGQKTCSC